jgi:hypothetical protein
VPQDEFQFEEPKEVLRIKAKRFVAPTHDAVRAEFARRGLPAIEAEKFFHHYESVGWVVGKNKKMVGWISAVAGWEIRLKERSGHAKPTIRDLDIQLRAVTERIAVLKGRGTTSAFGDHIRREDFVEYQKLLVKKKVLAEQIRNYE